MKWEQRWRRRAGGGPLRKHGTSIQIHTDTKTHHKHSTQPPKRSTQHWHTHSLTHTHTHTHTHTDKRSGRGGWCNTTWWCRQAETGAGTRRGGSLRQSPCLGQQPRGCASHCPRHHRRQRNHPPGGRKQSAWRKRRCKGTAAYLRHGDQARRRHGTWAGEEGWVGGNMWQAVGGPTGP